jgi:hypothetical protein
MLVRSQTVMLHDIELIHVKNVRLTDGALSPRLSLMVSWFIDWWAVVDVIMVVNDVHGRG